jgi:hypothetical protein
MIKNHFRILWPWINHNSKHNTDSKDSWAPRTGLPCLKIEYAPTLDCFATKEDLLVVIILLVSTILNFLSFQFMVNGCIMSMAFCQLLRNLWKERWVQPQLSSIVYWVQPTSSGISHTWLTRPPSQHKCCATRLRSIDHRMSDASSSWWLLWREMASYAHSDIYYLACAGWHSWLRIVRTCNLQWKCSTRLL